MDWIETLFHVSPDGGSGATELLYVASAAVAVLLLFRRKTLSLLRRFTTTK